jgi:hypothetical protein
MLALLVVGCGGDDTSGHLDVTKHDDFVERRAQWNYESFEVDVVLTLVTRVDAESCVSTGSLTVDEALSSKARYDLLPTDCVELELTEQGDIVLNGAPTGHDWSQESLAVDTDAELITLGPATLTNADGQTVGIRFVLSAPPCPDDPSCGCGVLQRFEGSMHVDLPLGKRC